MATNRETTTKFKVDISDLKKGISEANRQIRLANAEFKAAASGMENWEKSADGVTKKVEQLDKVLEAEERILDSYEKQLDAIVKEYGEGSKEADEMRIKIANQQAVVNKTSGELERYKGILEGLQNEEKKAAEGAEKQAHAYDDLKESVSDQQKRLDDLKDEYKQVVVEQGKNSKSAKELAKEIDYLSGELKDNKKAMNDADKAADDLDHSLDDLDPEGKANGFTILKGAIADLVSKGIQLAISAVKDFARDTLEAGKNFDASMSNVAALSGAVGDELEMLRDTAKEYGSTTKFSASQAADALGYMALAGWDAQQSADALGGVLNLAAASGMELADASDMVTDYMSAFSMDAEESAYFADLLAYAQANANTTASGLGEAFRNCAANMNAAGQDIETTVSLLSMMANQGLKGTKAGTALTAVMRDITKQMGSAQYNFVSFTETAEASGRETYHLSEAMKKIGVTQKEFNEALEGTGGDLDAFLILLQEAADEGKDVMEVFTEQGWAMGDLEDVFQTLGENLKSYNIEIGDTEVAVTDANGKFRDMTDILLDVEAATDGMEDAEKSAALSSVFTADSIKALNLILNSGASEAKAFEEELRNSSGSAEEMAKIMNDNLSGDLTALSSKLEGVQIALYEKLEPALRKGAEMLSGLLDGAQWVIDHGSEIIGVLTALGTAVGVYVAYTTALKIMQEGWMALEIVQKAVAASQAVLNAVMAANPIGIIIAAIAALVAAFVYLWNNSEEFRDFWVAMWEKIKDAVAGIVEWFTEIFTAIIDFFKDNWQSILLFLINPFAGLFKYCYDHFEKFRNFVDGVVQKVVGFFKGAVDWVKKNWKAIVAFLINPFAGVFKYLYDNFEGFRNFVNGIVDAVVEFFKGMVEKLKETFQPLIDFFATCWNVIAELAQGVWNTIVLLWGLLADWVNENVVQPVKEWFTKLFEAVQEVAQTCVNKIKEFWDKLSSWFSTNVTEPIKEFFSGLWEGLKEGASIAFSAVSGAWAGFSAWVDDTVIQPVSDFFSGMWDKVKQGASGAWEGIKSAFGTVADWFKEKFKTAWEAVKNVFSTGGKIFDGITEGITEAFKNVVNAIIKGINKVIAIPFNAINNTLEKIRTLEIAGVKPFSGVVSRFEVPEIPLLRKGGILKKGQTGFLEGDGAEAVVPLDENKGWISATAEALRKSLVSEGVLAGPDGSGMTGGQAFNFYQYNTSPKALDRLEIYRQTRNQLELAKGV